MSKLILEVIVTSICDAVEAELGGADRLELVSGLEYGGLTPDIDLVRQVVERVAVPVRVMLRESAHMTVENAGEVERLQASVVSLSEFPIDGFVLGFAAGGRLDVRTTRDVLAVAPGARATFHRAWDEAEERHQSASELKKIPQIDRILTNGGSGTWSERKGRLEKWREALRPEVQIIFGAGDDLARVPELIDSGISEIHIGRAVRNPQTVAGAVDRSRVAALRKRFSGGLD